MGAWFLKDFPGWEQTHEERSSPTTVQYSDRVSSPIATWSKTKYSIPSKSYQGIDFANGPSILWSIYGNTSPTTFLGYQWLCVLFLCVDRRFIAGWHVPEYPLQQRPDAPLITLLYGHLWKISFFLYFIHVNSCFIWYLWNMNIVFKKENLIIQRYKIDRFFKKYKPLPNLTLTYGHMKHSLYFLQKPNIACIHQDSPLSFKHIYIYII